LGAIQRMEAVLEAVGKRAVRAADEHELQLGTLLAGRSHRAQQLDSVIGIEVVQ
jgi:hypothetical protein